MYVSKTDCVLKRHSYKNIGDYICSLHCYIDLKSNFITMTAIFDDSIISSSTGCSIGQSFGSRLHVHYKEITYSIKRY